MARSGDGHPEERIRALFGTCDQPHTISRSTTKEKLADRVIAARQ